MKRLHVVLLLALAVTGCDGQLATGTSTPAAPATTSQTTAPTRSTSAPSVRPAPTTAPTARATATADPVLRRLVGQKLMVAMEGVSPSADLLGRIGRGEVGGVILFRANITTHAALMSLTAQLRAAAANGGQPALLIAVDQEGGSIKRIPWAPPTLSAAQMGQDGRTSVAWDQGDKTGDALRTLGIDIDLAPVADVPGSSPSFMAKAGRTFGPDATLTATLADAFASGLRSEGVQPVMKHFPGIGLAAKDTDSSVVTIGASVADLDAGLLPYRTAIEHGLPMIMLSNATYPAFDPVNAAGWSPAIVDTLLRQDLGFTGVTITDSLDGTARARKVRTAALALLAAEAGTDMILTTGSEATSRAVFAALLGAAEDGSIPLATLEASYDRILALKSG